MGLFSWLFGSSGLVVCTCKKCGTEYRLGENARVTTPEQMMKCNAPLKLDHQNGFLMA
jgi:hypothetical protein